MPKYFPEQPREESNDHHCTCLSETGIWCLKKASFQKSILRKLPSFVSRQLTVDSCAYCALELLLHTFTLLWKHMTALNVNWSLTLLWKKAEKAQRSRICWTVGILCVRPFFVAHWNITSNDAVKWRLTNPKLSLLSFVSHGGNIYCLYYVTQCYVSYKSQGSHQVCLLKKYRGSK